jgi:hypothetical protein
VGRWFIGLSLGLGNSRTRWALASSFLYARKSARVVLLELADLALKIRPVIFNFFPLLEDELFKLLLLGDDADLEIYLDCRLDGKSL